MNNFLLFLSLASCFEHIFGQIGHSGAVSLYPEPDGRIIGGTAASIQELPYQVSLQFRGQHMCGGSIISPMVVATAAHCVQQQANSPSSFIIRAGSSTNSRGGVAVRVCSVIVHERYSMRTQDNDIALLRLCQPLPSQSGIAVIPLPNSMETATPGTQAVVSGWGYTREGGSTTSQLLKVIVPIVEPSICSRMYAREGRITGNMICAGLVGTGGKDACQGDSGGPLAVNGRLVGIVSWGYGCARPRYPGIYTKVSNYRNWIYSKVGV